MSLGRWQPDLVLISRSLHKIAILEFCRPSDVRLARLHAAYQGKLTTYEPLRTALSGYTEKGWDVQILDANEVGGPGKKEFKKRRPLHVPGGGPAGPAGLFYNYSMRRRGYVTTVNTTL